MKALKHTVSLCALAVLLIELNDKSHKSPGREKRDAELQQFCQYTETPLLIITSYSYNTFFKPSRIRFHINKALEKARESRDFVSEFSC